jgi:hypothetical protein
MKNPKGKGYIFPCPKCNKAAWTCACDSDSFAERQGYLDGFNDGCKDGLLDGSTFKSYLIVPCFAENKKYRRAYEKVYSQKYCEAYTMAYYKAYYELYPDSYEVPSSVREGPRFYLDRCIFV